eukprot:CAMPEP_0179434746 /NCGR_PEP_ID=MMETSP0799-20121207/19002_1 /TAXON_ID=46947 /ORGANISM="Geminigera cryophila, Strain CCMP2564" /LENGTH=50 /DNA_ID=CAMNT_0021213717 /DNA_START=1822 /DNA_END=1974 /DNA_ORIENTATION=+
MTTYAFAPDVNFRIEIPIQIMIFMSASCFHILEQKALYTYTIADANMIDN